MHLAELLQTAHILHLQPAEVVQLHQEGVLTSTRPSSPLKFYREEVLAYHAQRDRIQLDPDEETPGH